MSGRTVKVCVPEEVYATLEDTAQRTGRSVEAVASEMLDEAARMRRVPGITFADSTSGRVARIAGTGLDVWEIIGEYRAVDRDWEHLKASFDWLSEQQLRAALAYAEAFPAEIEAAVAANASWTPDKIEAYNQSIQSRRR